MIAAPCPLAVLPAHVAVSLAQIVALVLVVALLAAVGGVLVALVTDDRDPTTILAWLLVIALLPVVGIVLYFFIGRNYRRHTPERDRLRAEVGKLAVAALGPTYEANAGYTARVERRARRHAGRQARRDGPQGDRVSPCCRPTRSRSTIAAPTRSRGCSTNSPGPSATSISCTSSGSRTSSRPG